ncbi:MAG: hypothetical protein AAB539_02145 [Patescibacteria group bacterium]
MLYGRNIPVGTDVIIEYLLASVEKDHEGARIVFLTGLELHASEITVL